MIKGIFFDAAGVLYRRSSPTEVFALNLLKQNNFATDVSPQALERQKAMRAQASEGRASHQSYWNEFLRMRGVTNPAQREVMVRQILEYSNEVLAVPGARETLMSLKKRGFVLGIVTDTMYPVEWKMRRLEKAGVAEFIDVVACSTVLGTHKPNPAIYLDALNQAHLTVSESAFVGHDASELNGAHQAGMTTVAVNYEPGTQADYYAESLLDLLSVPIFQENPT